MSTFLFTPPETPYTVDPTLVDVKPAGKRHTFPPSIINKYYDWLLFDADETLFAFDSWKGLSHMFAKYAFPFSKEHYEEYQKINKPLWDELQQGLINQDTLKVRRFLIWGERVTAYRREQSGDDTLEEVTPLELNDAYEDSLAATSVVLPGVVEFLNFLRFNHIKCGIVTNGFNRLQLPRLQNLGLAEGYFDLLVVSETVGVAKPNPLIFEHALKQIELKTGKPINKESVLMVGDNPHSDIAGGQHSGLDTCWINVYDTPCPPEIFPTYTIARIAELHRAILAGIECSRNSSRSSSAKYTTTEEFSSAGNSLKFT
jgi:5'-nucleotidase